VPSTTDTGNVDAAAELGRRVLRLAVIAATALGVLLAVGAWPLAHIFTSDPAVVSRATVALVLLALAQPAAGVAMSLDGVLIGAADYRFLGAAAGLSALAFVPLAVTTLAVPALGIVGVWAAVNVWMVARAGLNHHRFRSAAWTAAASTPDAVRS
jgi:MATE family, multidrug efflux pump